MAMHKVYYGMRHGLGSARVWTAWMDRHGGLHNDNPLQHVVRHSPDGFEWGYGGSGPSELARCILLDALGHDEMDWIDQHYQAFKIAFIMNRQEDSWRLPAEDVLNWVALIRRVEKDETEDASLGV